MISQLKGSVDSISGNKATIDVAGVGYEVHCSARCVARLELGKPAVVTIYTNVKEDSITLYGFEDALEKQVFLLLTSVQGVGPKSGAEIISRINKLDLLRTIGTGDATQLQRIKGVGKKLSERIIVELKDKVADFVQGRIERNEISTGAATQPGLDLSNEATMIEDAISAMEALGFNRRDAEKAVQAAIQQDLQNGADKKRDSGKIVRDALRFV